MRKIELEIVALSHSVTQSHNYAVVLGELEGKRRLPIVIGGFEAQAIAVAMESMTPNRPLTHDLFKNTMSNYNIDLKEIIISNLLDGIFYAHLVCDNGTEVIEVDSRTSDAIAMAVRFNCPIYTYEFIMDAAGVILDDELEGKRGLVKKEKKEEKGLQRHSLKALKGLLDEALSKEDYEAAAKIRDEINNRSKS